MCFNLNPRTLSYLLLLLGLGKTIKFLPLEEAFKVQSKLQAMALSKREQGKIIQVKMGPTSQQKTHATSFIKNILGSSDSTTSDEEEGEQELKETAQKEVLMYFRERPVSGRRVNSHDRKQLRHVI